MKRWHQAEPCLCPLMPLAAAPGARRVPGQWRLFPCTVLPSPPWPGMRGELLLEAHSGAIPWSSAPPSIYSQHISMLPLQTRPMAPPQWDHSCSEVHSQLSQQRAGASGTLPETAKCSLLLGCSAPCSAPGGHGFCTGWPLSLVSGFSALVVWSSISSRHQPCTCIIYVVYIHYRHI